MNDFFENKEIGISTSIVSDYTLFKNTFYNCYSNIISFLNDRFPDVPVFVFRTKYDKLELTKIGHSRYTILNVIFGDIFNTDDHSNVVVIDHDILTLYRFEPHGYVENIDNFNIDRHFKNLLIGTNYIYVNTKYQHTEGVQNSEKYPLNGYCIMWSYLFIYFFLLSVEKEDREYYDIYQEFYKYIYNSWDTDCDPFHAFSVICKFITWSSKLKGPVTRSFYKNNNYVLDEFFSKIKIKNR